MQPVGELLREERERQGRTLTDILAATRIRITYLEAIESGRVDLLPGGFFYKSFVRQYCEALEIDYLSLEPHINQLAAPEAEDPLPALSARYRVSSQLSNRSVFENPVFASVVILILVIAGCSGLYAWWARAAAARHAAAEAPATKTKIDESVAVPPSNGTTTATAPDTVSPVDLGKPEANKEESASALPVSASDPIQTSEVSPGVTSTEAARKLAVEVAATERTWVSLSSGGKTLFAGVLDARERKNIETSGQASLRTGNAAGLDVRWNGKPIGPIGARGEVKVVLFTPDKFEILSGSTHKL